MQRGMMNFRNGGKMDMGISDMIDETGLPSMHFMGSIIRNIIQGGL